LVLVFFPGYLLSSLGVNNQEIDRLVATRLQTPL
jgi:hypothetical protein